MRRLGELLGPSFEVAPYSASDDDGGPRRDSAVDATMMVRDIHTGTYTVLLLEAKRDLTPVGVRRELAARYELLRRLPNPISPVVVAPWLSPRTRQELDQAGYGYLDLTGNVSVDLAYPRVRLLLHGDQRDPNPRPVGQRTLAGPRAGRLVRLMADFAPPYRAGELANGAGLSAPYLSRLLDVMEERALIDRAGRVIAEVDRVGLLRERAASTSLLRANPAVTMLAPQGQQRVIELLANRLVVPGRPRIVVTGSVAAATVAPIAVGGQLMLYVEATGPRALDDVGNELGLLRSEGGDVLLLRAGDDVVFDREETNAGTGIRHVAFSQLVIDCLSGPGRMPAEGEAVLEYLTGDAAQWSWPPLDSPDSA